MIKMSDTFILGAAFLSFLLSIGLWFGFIGTADKMAGIFVGVWVPSIIALGAYLKIIALGAQRDR